MKKSDKISPPKITETDSLLSNLNDKELKTFAQNLAKEYLKNEKEKDKEKASLKEEK